MRARTLIEVIKYKILLTNLYHYESSYVRVNNSRSNGSFTGKKINKKKKKKLLNIVLY